LTGRTNWIGLEQVSLRPFLWQTSDAVDERRMLQAPNFGDTMLIGRHAGVACPGGGRGRGIHGAARNPSWLSGPRDKPVLSLSKGPGRRE